jgi:hypothetical protein
MADTSSPQPKSSFFSWFTGRTTTGDKKAMGTELGTKEGVKAHIQKLQGNVVKTSRIVQNNLEKYKEVKKLNEEITKSYLQNMVVFRDVNEMLQSCLGVFKSLEEEFGKLEEATGRELNTADFDYLTNMTRSRIDSLNTELNKQAEVLKKVYSMYGRPEELNRLILAQSNMNKVVDDASVAYGKIVGQNKKKQREDKPLTNVVFDETKVVSNVANVANPTNVQANGDGPQFPMSPTQSGGRKRRTSKSSKKQVHKKTTKGTSSNKR